MGHRLHQLPPHFISMGPKVQCPGSKMKLKKLNDGASLVTQWERICVPMEETWVRSLISGKIPQASEQ